MDPKETKIYIAVLIAAGILGIILVYFVISIIRHQRNNIRLQKANLLVEINTLENERARIVADLHDELGPLLSVVKFQVTSLDTQLPEDLELIEKASGHLDTTLERIRGICNHLMPQALIRKGLISALREFFNDLNQHSPIAFSFEAGDVEISKANEVHLYRMIQEIVQNALKHSGATRMSVAITSDGNKLVIIAKDNGKGFALEDAARRSSGLGLKNIMSRVDILKGELYLASAPNEGATYTIEIPNL